MTDWVAKRSARRARLRAGLLRYVLHCTCIYLASLPAVSCSRCWMAEQRSAGPSLDGSLARVRRAAFCPDPPEMKAFFEEQREHLGYFFVCRTSAQWEYSADVSMPSCGGVSGVSSRFISSTHSLGSSYPLTQYLYSVYRRALDLVSRHGTHNHTVAKALRRFSILCTDNLFSSILCDKEAVCQYSGRERTVAETGGLECSVDPGFVRCVDAAGFYYQPRTSARLHRPGNHKAF
jgi:hypothetical protein